MNYLYAVAGGGLVVVLLFAVLTSHKKANTYVRGLQ